MNKVPGLNGERLLADPAFLEALGVAVYTTDAHGVITQFNEAAAELWGRRPEIGIDQWCGAWRLYHPDGRPMALDACPMTVTLKEDRPVRGLEAIAERPDGTRVWIIPHPTPLHDTEGNLVGAVNVVVDITERKQAEIAASYLNAIITSSDDAIVSKNLDGIVTSWNHGAERLFGFRSDEVVGRSIRLIIPPDRLAEEVDVLAKLRRGERVEHFETVRRRKDGREVPISVTISPVLDKAGRIIGASKIARDISQQKESERAVSEALAVKDEFIGLVSHELRTPLTTIMGNAAILARRENAPDEESRLAAAADVEQSAVRLDRIIDDLLSLARLESGKIDEEPIVLSRVIERVIAEHPWKEVRRVDVRIECPDAIVMGDANLLSHVLTNYLSNAEKYSACSSSIEVAVECENAHGHVRVLDRGIGIDPAEADQVFDSFYRSGNVGNVGGIGIGLSVCRRLIRAIGGTCWASPREGGGSEFGFSLPLFEPTDDDA